VGETASRPAEPPVIGDGLSRQDGPLFKICDQVRAGRPPSRALWERETKPDGIIYDSRLTAETNLAVFDRALPKLTGGGATTRSVDCRSDLAAIIAAFDLAIV
jgi:hypothetical protein